MKSIAVLGFLGLLAGLVSAQDRQAAPVKLNLVDSARTAPRVAFPQARLKLTAKRPAGLKAPALGVDARYAVARFGGHSIPLGFDAPGGAFALGLLYAGGAPVTGRARTDQAAGTMIVDFLGVEAGARRIDVRLFYRGLELRDALLQPSRHRRGKAALGGSVRELILVDANGNGRYNDPADRWAALRVGAKRGASIRLSEAAPLGEPQIPFQDDGRALHVEKVSEDGSRATLVLEPARKPLDEVLDRRYTEVRREHFRRLRREAPRFAAKHGISGPRVKRPAEWSRLTLSEAKRRAKEAGKPLLVFYFSEKNVASYRYDYFTFPDKEVDAILRRFVLVRIDTEKDPENSYQRSGARLLPALVPFTKDGDAVEFKLMHRTPEGRVANLEKRETMISGWQRPQEFAINLKRIVIGSR